MKLAVVDVGYWGANLVRMFQQLGVLDRICESNARRIGELTTIYPDIRAERSFEVQCIETRRTPRTDGHDAWRVLKVLEASQRSLSMNGEPVPVETVLGFGSGARLQELATLGVNS